uniref:WW domain-containing protein n=1 Tax=Panagrolaimus sp. PS1159 TaxID=55785 RepID=A0AC35FZ42_9BILA
MASKRVENKKIQINTCVEDPFKSIDDLIRAGVEQKAKEGHYQRNGKLPASISKKPTKSRGSSVGHSPQGSSDDGFATLSPSSNSANTVNGYHPYNTPNSTVSHFRQGSAPALTSYNTMEHQQASSSRMVPGLPVAHGYSRSLNTVAISPEMHGNLSNHGSAYNIAPSMQSPELTATNMQPCHGTSKSLDLEAVNHNNLAIKQEAFDNNIMQPGGGYSHHQMQHGYYPNDHSLDPMTIAQMPTVAGNSPMGMTSPVACSSTDDPDDGLGPLPKGWSKSYDPQVNRAYFINHLHKTTTWNDPRIPKEMQENLRDRAMMSQNVPQLQQHQQQQYYLSQQQQNFQQQQQQDSSTVDRLRLERNNMLERQQQLFREGLLPPQQALYGNQQQQPMQQQYPNGYDMHHQQQHGGHRQYQQQQQQSDAMEDLNPADLNPHEFDKYLYIDRKPQQHVFH